MKQELLSCTFVVVTVMLSFANLAAAIEFNYDKSTLDVGQQILKPTKTTKSWRRLYHIGESQYAVAERTVAQLTTAEDKPVWTTESDDSHHLHWIAADETSAYLVGYEVDKDGHFQKYETPPRVRRLDIKTGHWLPDLPIDTGKLNTYKPKDIVNVLAGKNAVAVLTSFGKKQLGKDEEETVVAYEVRLFRKDSNKPVWSKSFSSAGERPYTGGYVWGVPPPQYAGSEIQHLSWMGDKLLVCPEAMQPIYCLNPDTGSEFWKLDRVWEFQRGFIGPSVWSHYISRFGIDEFHIKERSVNDARKDFDKQFHCALIAGPIPVRLNFDRGTDTHSIFTAVVKGPNEEWAGYLSDCLVYELDDSGKPISMAKLPQIVKGAQFCVQQDGVIWRCQNDTFVKVSPSPIAPVVSMDGSGSDGISHVSWLRQLQYREPEAWFVSGKAGDPVAFSKTHAFSIPGGGYVTHGADHIYRFPIMAIDLSTGLDSVLLLCVPFEGQFPVPTNNFSATINNGTCSYRTRMNYELSITLLAAYENELEITLATEKSTASIKFDIGKVLIKSASESQQTSEDTMEPARARVKALKGGDLDRTAP